MTWLAHLNWLFHRDGEQDIVAGWVEDYMRTREWTHLEPMSEVRFTRHKYNFRKLRWIYE